MAAIGDWGGGRDLSGLFAGLQDAFISQVEASKNRAIRKAEEDAAAEDQETFDKWQNGLITDDQWLDYIKNRREESRGDKKEFQRWTQTLREHTDAINDGRMESRYQSGEISIHDLIDYYADRMSKVKAASPEHRELSDRYYQMIDQRDGDYIDEQTAILVDKIERGQASYRDLLAFYQKMDKRIRSSSALKGQVKRQIINIQQIVDGVNGTFGGSGGGGGGRGGSGRGSGRGSGSGDVGTILQKTNDLVTKMYRTGDVFVPTGGPVVPSVFDMFDIDNNKDDILKAMEADSRYIEQMMEEWKRNPNDKYLTTGWGQRFENTPEMRAAIYNQAIANYDFRSQMYKALGDPYHAQGVDKAKGDFIDNYMKVDNGLGVQNYWTVKKEAFNETLNLAAVTSDPHAAFETYKRAARSLDSAANRLITQSNNAFEENQLDPDTLEELQYARQLSVLIENSDSMSPEEILAEGSMLLDQRPEGFYLTSENLESVIGNIDGPTGSGLAGKAAAREGYQATVDLRAGRETTAEPWVYVARAGESTPTLVRKSKVAEFLGLEDGDWMTQVAPFAERINIRDEPVVVYRQKEPYQPQAWYKDRNGKWVDYDRIEAIGRDPAKLGQYGYELATPDELNGWSQVTDGAGNVWYVSPDDGMLYERLPFRGGINGSFDTSDLVKDGKLMLERVQGAEGVVMGLGPGVSMRFAQGLALDAAASGEIDLELYHQRDVATGHVSFDPLSLESIEGMYWSPADTANETLRRNTLRHNYDYKRDSAQRALAVRNEQRRIARVREWYDETNLNRQFQKEAIDSVLDNAILNASQLAGVTFGRSQRNVDETPAQAGQPRFEIGDVDREAAPPVQIAPIAPIAPKPLPATHSARPIDPIPKPDFAKNPVTQKKPAMPPKQIASNRRPVRL